MAEKSEVIVTYNGEDRTIEYNPHATVAALLEHAKQAFGVQSNHLLSLFTTGNVEIKPEDQSAEAAGIKPGEMLILRQSTVKGG